MVETLLGGILGGVFRVIPEVLKWFDRKDERKHEIAMTDKQIEFEQVRGAQKMAEIEGKAQADWNTGALDALKTAISGQEAPSGVKWIDGFNKLIRPLMAFQWVICLYPAVILAGFILAVQTGTPPLDALVKSFGPDEKAFTSAIANFWILNRVFTQVK